MDWARQRGYVVLTHDLDFGTILAQTKEGGPSVLQVRTQDTRPGVTGPLVLRALRAHGGVLASGALVTVSAAKERVRILPF